MKNFNHIPVLLKEVIDALNLKPGMTVVDCTVGGAGHSKEIAKRIGKTGRLICIDKDAAALETAKKVLSLTDCPFTLVHDDFANLATILKELDIEKVNAVLADIGVSSHQIDTPERGFSYMQDAPLDMRMNREQKKTAGHVVNNYNPQELERIIYFYGEERCARRIVQQIVAHRPIQTTLQLSNLIKEVLPASYGMRAGHPAKRTFQAIRIEVNSELEALERLVKDSSKVLEVGGRVAIISFHSLEDRIVKNLHKVAAASCLCPPRTPICICGHKATVKILTKNPIVADSQEITVNPRAASAKLRVAERI